MFDFEGRVLICDDFKMMLKIVDKSLRQIGFKDIVTAKDGEEAWNLLNNSEKPITLIVSDWNMPRMTGLDFLKKVRATPNFAKLPFVLLTAESEKGQIAEAIKEGVTNYVLKPFSVATLTQKMEESFKIWQKKGAA